MKQGEIWMIDLNPTVGSEIKKVRPALIVNDDTVGKLPLRVIVPITDWKNIFSNVPWMVKLAPNNKNGLSKLSTADCFQVRSVSIERFIKKIVDIDIFEKFEVKKALANMLSIDTI